MRYGFSSFLLIVTILIISVPVVVLAQPSDWAVESVQEAIDARLVPDALQDDYQSNITRQEFCQVALRFLEQTLFPSPEFNSDIPSPFHDVDDFAVSWAYQMGVVSGVGAGVFNPEAPITRQEAAVMLYNMAGDFYGAQAAGAMDFMDENAIAGWARSGVLSVAGSGVLQGTSANRFDPGGYFTREQCFTSVLRQYNLVKQSDSGVLTEEKPVYEALPADANIRQLQEYITANPNSDYVDEAKEKIETLKNDPKPYQAVLAKGITEEAVEVFLADYPGHSQAGELKEALKEAATVIEETIHTLVAENKISVTVKGEEAINRSVIKVTNKTKSDINVTIPFGTWFKSKSSSVQNMLVTDEPMFLVKAGETLEETIATACLNMYRNIPGSSDSLTLDTYSDNHKITKLLKNMKNDTSYPVLQAAIWMITDNATDDELLQILVDSSGRSVLNENAIKQAKQLIK